MSDWARCGSSFRKLEGCCAKIVLGFGFKVSHFDAEYRIMNEDWRILILMGGVWVGGRWRLLRFRN